MPQGNCLQENMASVTARNSHGFYPVKNYDVETLNTKKSHLDVLHTIGVFVCFRGALGDTTSCSSLPQVGL